MTLGPIATRFKNAQMLPIELHNIALLRRWSRPLFLGYPECNVEKFLQEGLLKGTASATCSEKLSV